jgi:hypothetical protein
MLRANLLFQQIVFFALLSLVSACQPTPPLPTPVPTSTATMIPTNTPTPQPSPTSVDVSAREIFTHPGNRFSIDYPENWQVFPQDNGVIVLEPAGQFGYSVVFSDVGETYTSNEMNRYVASFVAQNFAPDGSNFQAISYNTANDGTITARFSTIDPEMGPTIGQLMVLQKDTLVFALYLNAAEAQWEDVEAPLTALVNSFAVLDSSPVEVVEAGDATPTPPVWALTGPQSKEFGFLAASNWQTTELADFLITVTSPEGDMQFTASNAPWPGALSNPNAATEAALAHIAQLQNQYAEVQHLPPAEFPVDTTSGATIDFVYTTKEGQTVAGSVVTAVGNNKMHTIVFTAPAQLYDLGLEWFNPMLKSFKFLSPEDGLPEGEN